MMRQSPTATKISLDATLKRILGRIQVVADDELGPVVSCVRCHDFGVVEMISGRYELAGDRFRRHKTVEASRENPVYVPCECRRRDEDEKPRARKSFSAAS